MCPHAACATDRVRWRYTRGIGLALGPRFRKPSLSQLPGDFDEKERSCGGAGSGRHTGNGAGAVRAPAAIAASFRGDSAIATTTAASPRTASAATVRGTAVAAPISAASDHSWLRRSKRPVLPRRFLYAPGARPCVYLGVGKWPFRKRIHLGDRDCAQRIFRGNDRTRSSARRRAASCRWRGAVHRRPERCFRQRHGICGAGLGRLCRLVPRSVGRMARGLPAGLGRHRRHGLPNADFVGPRARGLDFWRV